MSKKILGLLLSIALFVSSCNFGMYEGAKGISEGNSGSVLNNNSPYSSGFVLPDGGYYKPKDEDIIDGFFIVKTKNDFDSSLFENKGFAVKGSLKLGSSGFTYWYLNKEGDNKKNLLLVSSIKGVLSAENDYKVEGPDGKPAGTPYGENLKEDELIGTSNLENGNYLGDPIANNSDYGLSITEALRAYSEMGYGDKDVVIGIIDTGINMTHKDFYNGADSLVLYAKSCATDSTGGTYIGEGAPFTEIPIGQNWDKEAHGTHCSGTMLARGNNGVGIAGVAWKNTKLISYQSLGVKGGGRAWAVYGAMLDLVDTVEILRKAPADRSAAEKAKLPSYLQNTDYQITQKTVPVNMSLGGSYGTEFAFSVLTEAVKNHVLPVIAMGNEGRYTAAYPAAFPGVLAVGATNGKDKKVHFSNSGAWISVSAPGDGIKSCGIYGDNDYETMSGTSMATPFVTGTIGYLLSFAEAHDLTPYQIKALLEQTADKVDGKTGFTEEYGHGRVNVYKAAKALKDGAIPAPNNLYSEASIKVKVTNNTVVMPAKITLIDEETKAPLAYVGDFNGRPVEFKGLVKGRQYSVYGTFLTYAKKETFTVTEADKNIDIAFAKDIIYVSTVPNLHYNSGTDTTDTKIIVYKADSSGNLTNISAPILVYDQDRLDTCFFEKEAGAKYHVAITGFVDNSNNFHGGNYVIKIGDAPLDPAGVDLQDDARTAAQNDTHENDDTPAGGKAKGNAWNQTYACNLAAHQLPPPSTATADDDWFYIEP